MFLRPAIQRFQNHNGRLAACTILAAAVMVALAGCSATPDESKPTATGKLSDVFATPDWAKFTTGERTKMARAITSDDLIGADGSCAATRIATPAAEPPPQPLPQQPEPQSQKPPETDGAGRRDSAPATVEPSLSGSTINGGIALAMSECDVAQRAGFPGNVEIGSEAGERSAVLTYRQGPWPGIYRFRGGRLVSIERVEVIEPPKPKKIAKPAKPTRPPTRVDVGAPKAQ